MEDMSSTLGQFLHYSYQYNIKILGFPEFDNNESASTTTALCLKFFKTAGVEISCYDINIEFPKEMQFLVQDQYYENLQEGLSTNKP